MEEVGWILAALEEAASASVETPGMEITSQKVNPQELQEAEKLGPTAIPKYLQANVQALKFEIGKSYVPNSKGSSPLRRRYAPETIAWTR